MLYIFAYLGDCCKNKVSNCFNWATVAWHLFSKISSTYRCCHSICCHTKAHFIGDVICHTAQRQSCLPVLSPEPCTFLKADLSPPEVPAQAMDYWCFWGETLAGLCSTGSAPRSQSCARTPSPGSSSGSFSSSVHNPHGAGSGKCLRQSTWHMKTYFTSLLLQNLTQSLWENAWKYSDFFRIMEQFRLEVTFKGQLVKLPANLDTTLVTYI